MIKISFNKLRKRAGETIAETLIALLISALALTMLAAAISTATGMITRTRTRLDNYYNQNELDSGVVKMKSGGTTSNVTIVESSGSVNDKVYEIKYFKNTGFSKTPVVAYKES